MKAIVTVFAVVCVSFILYLDWPKQGQPPGATSLAIAPANLPRSSWEFAGYADPVSAFQSAIWAWGHGDKEKFLASLSPEAQQNDQQQFAGIKPADMAHEFRDVTGFHILGGENVADDQVVLHVFTDGVKAESAKKDVRLRKVGNDWKLAAMP